MQRKALKIGLTTTVLAAAFIGLLWTTMADGAAYYQHVDEVMVETEAWHGKRLQVHGYAEDIRVRPKKWTTSLTFRTTATSCTLNIPASCRTPSRTTRKSSSRVV